MRDHLRPVLHKTAATARNLASQMTVAVITGVSVALITNAILANTGNPGAPASEPTASAATHTLQALQPVVIRDVPAPLSRAPAAIADPLAPFAGAGLYFAAKEPAADPLILLTQPQAQPPA